MNRISILALAGIVLILGGMIFLSIAVSDLRNDVQNVQLSLELFARGGVSASSSSLVLAPAGAEDAASKETILEGKPIVLIPTAIIFKTTSSSRLRPQASIPIIIERVSKNQDGDVLVELKAFTSEATSYSALDVRNLFELVNLAGANERPEEVRGSFDSMPWDSAISGFVVFSVPPSQQKVILQITADDKIVHYEFDFNTKTYKQVVLG